MDYKHYDLVLQSTIHPASSTSNLSKISDGELVNLYQKKISRKQDYSASQRSPSRFKISRDYEVVFIRNKVSQSNLKGISMVLNKIAKTRVALGFQKIKEVRIWDEMSISSMAISDGSINKPKDYMAYMQGLDDLNSFMKRKVQMAVVIGFTKITFQQKQIIKKREDLEKKLQILRIQQLLSKLRRNTRGRRNIGVQTGGVYATSSSQEIIQKVQSCTTMLQSLASKNKINKMHKLPSTKIKSKHIDITSIDMEDTKHNQSQISFQTINYKLNRLEDILKEAQKIKKDYKHRKEMSARSPQERFSEKPKFNNGIVHSCSQIYDRHHPHTRLSKPKISISSRTITNARFDQSATPKSIAHKDTNQKGFTQKQPNIETKVKVKLNNIIQPVIHQIIQPIHYYNVPYSSAGINLRNVEYIPQIIYKPVIKRREAESVYSSIPNRQSMDRFVS